MNRIQFSNRSLFTVLISSLFSFFLLLTSVGFAQEKQQQILEVKIPKTHLSEYLQEKCRGFIRLDRDEYEKLRKQILSQQRKSRGPRKALIVNAKINAMIRPNQPITIDSTVKLSESENSKSNLLWLGRPNFTLKNARGLPDNQPLESGTDAEGTLFVDTKGLSKLSLGWENRTIFRPDRSSKIRLGVLPASSSVLYLDLPNRFIPWSDKHRIRKAVADESETDWRAIFTGFSRWIVNLPGDSSEIELTIDDSSRSFEETDPIQLSQVLDVNVVEDRVLVNANLQLKGVLPDVLQIRLPNFYCESIEAIETFQSDSGTQIPFRNVEAEQGSVIRFESKDLLDNDQLVSRIRVRGFYDHVVGSDVEIRPLAVSGSLMMTCEGTLSLPPSFRFRELQTQSMEIKGDRRRFFPPTSFGSEAFRFVTFDNDAVVRFKCKPLQNDLDLQSDCRIQASSTRINARQQVQLKSTQQIFSVIFALSDQWIIDSVEPEQNSNISVSIWNTRTGAAGRTLFVQISKNGIETDAGDVIRLVINAHRRSSPNQTFKISDLNVARLLRRDSQSDLKSAYTIQLAQNPSLLTRVAYRDHLRSNLGEWLFDADEEHTVQFRPNPRVEFDAETSSTVSIFKQRVTEDFALKIIPRLGAVNRVDLTVATEIPFSKWVAGDKDTRFTAKLVEESAAGQKWRLNFSPAISNPTTLKVKCEKRLPHAGNLMVPAVYQNVFMACDAAKNIQRIVAFGIIDSTNVDLSYRAAKRIPNVRMANDFATSLGTFSQSSIADRIKVKWKADALEEGLPLVHRADYVTRMHRDGLFTDCVYQLTAKNGGKLKFNLPNESQLVEVQLNGQKVAATDDPSGSYELELPISNSLSIRLLLFRKIKRWVSTAQHNIPELELPVLATTNKLLVSDAWVTDSNTNLGDWKRDLQQRYAGGLLHFFQSRIGDQSSFDNPYSQTYSQQQQFGFQLRESIDMKSDCNLLIIRRVLYDSMLMAVFAIGFAFPLALSSSRRASYISLFALLIAVLFVPVFYAKILSMLTLGSLLGILLTPFLYSPKRNASADRRFHQVSQLASCILIVLVFASSCKKIQSQEGWETKFQRVVIPVDESGKAVGNDVYVPKDLNLKSYTEEPSGGESSLPSVAFLKAEFKCTVKRTVRDENRIDEIQARISFNTTAEEELVFIPLEFVDTDSFLLDGEPVENFGIQTREDSGIIQSGVSIQIDMPGQHTLSYAINPREKVSTRWKVIELKVPPIHHSSIEIQLADDVEVDEIESANNEFRYDDVNRSFKTNLGADGDLQFRFSRSKSQKDRTNTQFIDQLTLFAEDETGFYFDLLWLPQEGSDLTPLFPVDLNVSWKVDETASSQKLFEPTREGDQNQYLFQPSEAIVGNYLRLRLRPIDALQLGRIQIPQPKLEDVEIQNNLLGLGRFENRNVEFEFEGEQPFMDSREGFVDRWTSIFDGEMIEQAFSADSVSTFLLVTPKSSSLSCETNIVAITSKSRMDINAELLISPNSPILELKIQFPNGYFIENIRRKDQRDVWTAIDGGIASLHFSEPISDPISLLIAAKAIAVNRQFAFPVIDVDKATEQSLIVDIKRNPLTYLEIKEPVGFEPHVPSELRIEGQTIFNESAWKRKLYFGEQGTINVSHKVRKDSAQVMLHSSGESKGGFEIRVLQRSGRGDLYEFELDSRISDSFESSRDGIVSVKSSSISGRKILQFIPDYPVRAGEIFQLSPSVDKSNQELPLLFWSNVASIRNRYISLPKTIENKPAKWNVSGLTKSSAQEKLRSSFEIDGGNIYSIDGDYRIELARSNRVKTPPAKVIDSWCEIKWQGLSQYEAETTLIFSSGSTTNLELSLPPTLKMQAANMMGDQVPFELVDGKVSIPVAASQYPQILKVHCLGKLTQHENGHHFEISKIAGSQTKTVFLTYPSSMKLLENAKANSAESSIAVISHIAKLIELPALLPPESTDELKARNSNWLMAWNQEFELLVSKTAGQDYASDPTIEGKLNNALAEREKWIQVSDSLAIEDDLEFQSTIHILSGQMTFAVNVLNSESQVASGPTKHQIWGCVAILLLFAFGQVHAIKEWIYRYQHSLAALLIACGGMLWANSMRPQFIGWLLVLAAIILSLRIWYFASVSANARSIEQA